MTEQEEMEVLAARKRALWPAGDMTSPTLAGVPRARRVVAEGDSWFDYWFAKDVLDHLASTHRYEICKVAKAGDTLENMAYGYGYPRERPLDRTLREIAQHEPASLLLSAGGNDVVGTEFASFLNHRASGLPALRAEHARFAVEQAARDAYQYILARVWKLDPELHVFAHGYAHAVPSGRGGLALFGWSFVGPWLKPALVEKNIDHATEGRALVASLIDGFNAMLADLESEHANFHWVDARALVDDADWRDELHLEDAAYGRIAAAFADAMQGAVGSA